MKRKTHTLHKINHLKQSISNQLDLVSFQSIDYQPIIHFYVSNYEVDADNVVIIDSLKEAEEIATKITKKDDISEVLFDYTQLDINCTNLYLFATILSTPHFSPGSILLAKDRNLRAGYHPIVFLEAQSSEEFIGIMLTHSSKHNNVKINPCYFENQECFYETYMVPRLFIKYKNWGPFLKINQLTEEGLNFISTNLINSQPEPFSNYYAKLKRNEL